MSSASKSTGRSFRPADRWTQCLSLAGLAGRPLRFATARGSGHALQTLRRAPAAEPAAADPARDGAPTDLEGEWSMTSCIQDGQPMAQSFAKRARRVFHRDSTTLYIAGQVSAQSRIRVQAGELDYLDLGQLGIYEISKESLRISMAEPGGSRPGDFSAVPGARRPVNAGKRCSR